MPSRIAARFPKPKPPAPPTETATKYLPSTPSTPLQSPSQVAGGLAQEAANIPGHLGANVTRGLNSPFVQTNPVSPRMSPTDVLFGLGHELGRAHDTLLPVTPTKPPQFSGMPPSPQSAPQGVAGMGAGAGLPPFIPPPKPTFGSAESPVQHYSFTSHPFERDPPLPPGPQPSGIAPAAIPFGGPFPNQKPPQFQFGTGPVDPLAGAVAYQETHNNGAPGPAKAAAFSQPGTISAPTPYTPQIQSGLPPTNEQAAAVQKQTGYQAKTTVGGAYGRPSYFAGDQITKDIAKDKLNARSQPLNVEIAKNMLQGPGQAAKQHQFDVGTPFSDMGNKYNKDANGRITRGIFSSTDTEAADKAKAMQSSPERQQYLNNRREVLAGRQQNVINRGLNKGESREFARGRMSNADRLAFSNPQASAYRDVGLAQAAALGQKHSNDYAYNQQRLKDARKIAKGRDAAMVEASKNRAIGQAAAHDMPNPYANPKADSKPPTEADIKLMPKDQQMEHLQQIHGPAGANDIMNQWHGTQGHNYVQQPDGPQENFLSRLLHGLLGAASGGLAGPMAQQGIEQHIAPKPKSRAAKGKS